MNTDQEIKNTSKLTQWLDFNHNDKLDWQDVPAFFKNVLDLNKDGKLDLSDLKIFANDLKIAVERFDTLYLFINTEINLFLTSDLFKILPLDLQTALTVVFNFVTMGLDLLSKGVPITNEISTGLLNGITQLEKSMKTLKNSKLASEGITDTTKAVVTLLEGSKHITTTDTNQDIIKHITTISKKITKFYNKK
jgi:hypothetical protein